MTPLLELRGVDSRYTVRRGLRAPVTVHAVNGVDLTIRPGETVGLVGESGCGKSTLSRTILRLKQPTAGDILFDGRPLREIDEAAYRRQVQMVFQDPYASLPQHMKAGRIVAEPMLIHRTVSDKEAALRRAAELMRDVGLPAGTEEKFPGQLSGGQRQRVGIARALALDPSLIVADEAVSALDVSVQAQILNLLAELQRERRLALLFVSHDIDVVRFLCQRIAVMYLGRIVEVGPAAAVHDHPHHPYTRVLMDAVPTIARRGRPRIEVRGDPPDPLDPPTGCAFHPRCPFAQDICRTERPALTARPGGGMAACHFGPEELASMEARRDPGSAAGDTLGQVTR
ncbi:ABC transporter ATP-binding protein [Nocardioides sp. BYT-33-1]|uniref:ABC transporter ATP-binding protein n=1 Tax=Nocardioides sp. BYT-33-1 TaxID=3416952 RepID=UPI003F53112D